MRGRRSVEAMVPIRVTPSSAANLSIARRLEHDSNLATSTRWTHEPRFEARQWEVRSACADQSFEV